MKARLLVIFTSLPEVGGHTTATLKLCEMLRPTFGRICVVIKDIPGHGFSAEACGELARTGVHTIRCSGRSAREWWEVATECRNADVFLAIGMRHLSPVLALLIGARQSIYYHITHELNPATLRQLRIYGGIFSKLVFISPATSRLYPGRDGLDAKPEWALQPTELPRSVAFGTERRTGPIRFGFLGRLTDEKGIGLLAELVESSPVPCELHIAGRGPQEPNLRQCQERRPDRFFFRGAFAAVERGAFLSGFFSGIDRLCVPSLDDREGIPNVILEALQFGVPVLATRTGGMRSFEMSELGPADPGVIRLVPPQEFSGAFAALVSAPPPSAGLREQCRNYFEAHFSDGVLAIRWRRIFAVFAE
ncbi:MAG: glycosyltransferase family 4 protein [Terrimicrobiaceae bacterium]